MENKKMLVCCFAIVGSLQTFNFERYLKKHNNDIPNALKLWAQDIIHTAANLNELSDEISQFLKKNPDLDFGAHAEDESIWFDDCEGLYEHLSNKQLMIKDYF